MLDAKPQNPPQLYIRFRLYILLILTLIGAVMRFATLDRPPLWGDEALTYSRVIGSFSELINILRYDAFTPLHYEIYWWMQDGLPIGPWHLAPHLSLTPKVMRFVPALCGTLMIPAMYFAARQIASVRTALLAAGYACVSAYLMAYSHDAKMYAQTWFFVALNLGCAWWWLRTGSTTVWLAWIATGLAAVGFHIAAALLIVPQPLMLLTSRHAHWRRAAAMLVGLVVIAAGPVGYYACFNQWTHQTGGLLPEESSELAERAADWKNTSGIGWVDDRNQKTTGQALVQSTASAYLIGTETADAQNRALVVEPLVESVVKTGFVCVLVVLILGALPWRLPWKPQPAVDSVFDPLPEPGWRVLLWLTLALLVPVYGFFYCRSVHDFAGPVEWWQAIHPSGWQWPLCILMAAVLVYFSGYTTRQRITRSSQVILVVIGVLALCFAIHAFWLEQYARHWAKMREVYGPDTSRETRPDLDWMSLWMPRYIGIVWPAMAIAVCALIMRLPTRTFRPIAVAILLGINATNSILRLTLDTQPPHPRFFADAATVRDSSGATRVVLSSLDPKHYHVTLWLRASNYGIYGDIGHYYACIYFGLSPTPEEFRSGEIVGSYRDWIGDVIDPADLSSTIDPHTTRLIVWERYTERFDEPANLPADDAIIRALGSDWHLTRPPEIFRLRSWYEWGNMGWMRRREFIRSKAF